MTLGLPLDVAPAAATANHLSPADFHAAIAAGSSVDTVLVDTRNLYESRVGTFVAPGTASHSEHHGTATP